MSDHDQVYGDERERRLRERLIEVAARIRELEARSELLARVPELLRLLGEARSELFHYEVRVTYDTPELAEHRKLVERAAEGWTPDDEGDEELPWRNRRVD
ncbi:MAG TPA: hypothetical protein VGR60_01255 [Gemmatimonadales bacterium]|nr:hypothetical protein [Gemmatimonadales bacterium]